MAFKNIKEFIASFPKETQKVLNKIYQTIKSEAPEAEEAMVYGIPTFKFKTKNLVHFSAFAKHIGFYPTPSGITAFKKDLVAYKHAKGSIQFPLNQEIPYALIKKIVAFRVKEIKIKK